MSTKHNSEDALCTDEAPDIDYSNRDAVDRLWNFGQITHVLAVVDELTPGDEVLINNRSRKLEVVNQSETDRLKNVYQDTIFLKGNGTEYRIVVHEHGFPRLDRGEFTTNKEYVATIDVMAESESEADAKVNA